MHARDRVRLYVLEPPIHAYRRAVCDLHDTVVVAGSPRSGTTWVADSLAQVSHRALINEPLFIRRIPRARKVLGSWRPYVPRNTDDAPLTAFMTDVLTGQVGALNLQGDRLRVLPRELPRRKLVVKFVRANRMLGWLDESFQVRMIVFLLRHPCAVVSSQMEMGRAEGSAWAAKAAPSPERLHAAIGGTLPDELVSRYETAISQVRSGAGVLASTWAWDNLLPLLLEQPSRWRVLPYESMVNDPGQSMMNIAAAVGETFDDLAVRSLPSPASLGKFSANLSVEEVDEILAVVHAFGFDFYSDSPLPDMTRLRQLVGSTALA